MTLINCKVTSQNCLHLLSFQTIGAAFGAKTVNVNGKLLTMGIWVREASSSLLCGTSERTSQYIVFDVQNKFWVS